MKRLLLQRIRDAWAACICWPTAAAWRRCALYYLAFVVCAVPVGVASGLLRFEPLRAGPGALLLLAVSLLLRPALVEEIVFRGLLLPRDYGTMSRRRLLAICGMAICLYVASHVVNGLLFRHGAVSVFTNPWFLALAAMLGAMCTAAYLTSGSVWPGVVAHWFTVTVWILLLGGQSLVGAGPGPPATPDPARTEVHRTASAIAAHT